MKHSYPLTVFIILAVILISGCASGATIGNVGVPGSAKNVEQSTIGKNDRLVYMSDGELAAVCDTQAQIITGAGLKASEEMRDETTYRTATYSDGNTYLTLMCSQQEENAGIKVTLTLQK